MCNIYSDTNVTDPPSPFRVKPSPRQPIRVHLLYSNHGKKIFKFCPFVDVPCHSSHIRAGPFHKQAEAPGGRSLEKVGSPTSFCTESEFSLFFYGISYIFLRIAWTANIHGPTFGIKILWSIRIKPNQSYTSFLHCPIYLIIRFEMKEALWKKLNYVSKILILLQ